MVVLTPPPIRGFRVVVCSLKNPTRQLNVVATYVRDSTPDQAVV